VAQVAQIAEGAIVASALLDYLGRLPAAERAAGARQFVAELRAASGRT
jgi:tryptophan synthase alpha chain